MPGQTPFCFESITDRRWSSLKCRDHGARLPWDWAEPAHVDVAVERWQQFTGQTAVLTGDERTFDDLKADREAA